MDQTVGSGAVSSQREPLGCACCELPLKGGFVRLWPDTNIRVCYDCLDWMNSQRDLQIQRTGGPVRLLGHEPILLVLDVSRAVRHYQALGFGTELHDATYAFASLGNLTLHLALHDGRGWPGYQPAGHMTSVLYLHVDDADRLAADWRQAGLNVLGPNNEDYGKREGQHLDPDGNLIRFGSPIPS